MDNLTGIIKQTLMRLDNWVRRNGWAGYDPYDLHHWHLQLPKFLREAKYFRHLSKLPLRAEGRYPYFVRRALRIKKRIFPKAMGLFTESYTRMYEYFGNDEYLQIAEECAAWLVDNVPKGHKGYGWGLPIDWQSLIFIPKGTPCGIVSVICGEGFWKLHQSTGKSEYLEYCCHVCDGFLRDLNIDEFADGSICFSFTPLDHFHVHNPNIWIASYLVKIGQHIENQEYIAHGLKAAEYALIEQRQDGSLTYWGRDQDITGALDHYHSGFEIRALHSLWKLTGAEKFKRALTRFYDYYILRFIGEDGAPLRNPGDPTLIDIHGCAEALICNAQLSDDFPQAKEILKKSARWTINNMQSPDGYFIYRILSKNGRDRRIDIPYIRWGQAWMMRGLTAALDGLKERKLQNHVTVTLPSDA